ncbi:MAG TPA: right-handed parallel beta-helix repeat-containing protein [Anaerolineales bacterium]|nr:right-handed parallel beta-helix repeat-containing protein [Anaerolineales bacterium]
MITPTDDLYITEDTKLESGIYYVPNGLTILEDGITLDGNGALLVGKERFGRGIRISGRSNVTIKNLRLQEYEFGIHAQDSQNLTISNCRITATAETPANTIFLNVWLPAEKSYGGGIFLKNVSHSQVLDNDLQHQMNGLHTYHCQHLAVRSNNASYCSGWGFHLYDTCDSLFEANTADYCCRYQPHGERTGHLGADAAGFLMVYNSCRNTFRRNNARMGGDGFFVGGMTSEFEPVGCNDNLFEENDGSYSPNIAFEATFCSGNVFRGNYANASNYGFWLGFSSNGVLENNQIINNRLAGIATENGCHFEVRNNLFQNNGHGLLLWSKQVPAFAKGVPDNDTSHNWVVEGNTFHNNRKAIRIAADQDHGVRPLPPTGEWGLPAPMPHHHAIRRNRLENNQMDLDFVRIIDTITEENTGTRYDRRKHHQPG